ncbi:hypothetical protein [Aequorivita sublithincola]|nr:hypothetical protein [Aequorivita sublithincola]
MNIFSKTFNMEDKEDNTRPDQRPIDPDKNNANQEKEYRKDKRKGKIDKDDIGELED